MNSLATDFEFIFQKSQAVFNQLKGSRVFITGGTGFFGHWIMGSICYANRVHACNIRLTALTRDPKSFLAKSPHFSDQGISFLQGDIRDFVSKDFSFDYLIHGATSASVKLNIEAPNEMHSTIVEGAEHFLKFAEKTNAKRILFLSSGAVYGTQDSDATHQPEQQDVHASDTSKSAYALGKREAEVQLKTFAQATGCTSVIARCYAFVGPYLPLDQHFAIGNFINNCLMNKDILVQGDGTPHRSYLYAADLVVWLLTILVRGGDQTAYNVGSEESFSIVEIAKCVKSVWMSQEFAPKRTLEPKIILQKSSVPGDKILRYVPATALAKNRLGLQQWTSLEEGIRRTFKFHLGIR